MVFFFLSLGSFAAGLVLTPLVGRLAALLGAVDFPNARKTHGGPVPRLGGAALFAAFFLPQLVLLFVGGSTGQDYAMEALKMRAFFSCSLALFLLGAVDDLRGLTAPPKFAVEIAVGCAMYYYGFAIRGITVPMVGPIELGILALPVTVLWFVGVANAVNLIDGIDGAAAGITAIAALSLGAAITGETGVPLILACCLIGACAGFLVHNFHPARIFMGDSGSLFLGFTLATLATMSSQKGTAAVAMLVPLSALAVPLADTALAMVRRALHRHPLFSGDNGHIHHKMLASGMSVRKTVFSLYAISALCGLVAVALSRAGGSQALVLVALLGIFFALVLRRVGILKPGLPAGTKEPSPEASAGSDGTPAG